MANASSSSTLPASSHSHQDSLDDRQQYNAGDISSQTIQNRLRHWRLGSPEARLQSSADVKGRLGLNLLHEPSDPRFDFVFIHGLLGGSRKTWSHSPEPGMFWPKDWLPNETGFEHVRLHSYGYNSDWTAKKESHLCIHDFGQALLADLHNSPHLRRTPETPIVLIAHSMGGLVAKKAYILSHEDPLYQTISRRIQCIYFLGTPHRGAALARLVKLLCQKGVYRSKAFVGELVPGSASLGHINDEFRILCGNIDLWSFFEGVETSAGPMSMLVVDKKSAVLGLPGEHVQYIEADHRHICKFDSQTNPNYLTLQRCFLTTIEKLKIKDTAHRQDIYRSQMTSISSFLQIERAEDTILVALKQKHHPGSCEWLTVNDTFREWLGTQQSTDPHSQAREELRANTLWLSGRPGTGKSVAAAHVISLMDHHDLDYSFHFFRHNDRDGSKVYSMLRSIALQMAKHSPDVRKALSSMIEDGVTLNYDDHHALWNRVFVDCILKLERRRPHFWIVDAVDECPAKEVTELASILSKLNPEVSVRIFLTARPGGQLGKSLVQGHVRFSEIKIGLDQTLKDIELYLTARCPAGIDPRFYPDLVPEILSNSHGIFLWASLVMSKLEDAYTVEDTRDILRNMPTEMDDFYTRIVTSVAASPNSEFAKCVLRWTICSPKPMTIGELAHAIKLDIGRTLTATASQLEAIVGHLIYIDDQSRTHIIHETAASFLTQKRAGFWIDRNIAHATLAEICLGVLCGSEFAPPRSYRGVPPKQATADSILSEYASTYFSYHLLHGSHVAEQPCRLLDRFLRSNVLTWMEKIAHTGDLLPIQRALDRMEAYFNQKADYQPQSCEELQSTAQIVVDIGRLVYAFDSCLLASPSSVHFLIPHLCPCSSIMRQLFGKETRRLRIATSLKEYDWTDRSTCHFFATKAVSVACSERFLAVGLCEGYIKVYKRRTLGAFDYVGMLDHWLNPPQLLLAFDCSSAILASCCSHKLNVWTLQNLQDSSFSYMWSHYLDLEPSDMRFSKDGSLLIIASTKTCSLVTFDAKSGLRRDARDLHDPCESYSSHSGADNLQGTLTGARIRLDKLCREYFKRVPMSEPTADFDDRNAVYAMKYHALLSIMYLKDRRYRDTLISELRAVVTRVDTDEVSRL
ncbi:hypothetical protein CONLIGDRAFT_470157 [Coniochaeta ligniaria NRRL 30616]|uniref:GPI inositol-deacylase n=1 Tax=Coniochaeta ligniaria NRRL 30616 TaxID=1408157 RepID=A0A1J7J994_9PEZI|nr:hypothetical protein CONLIGDRAFT_470157 [Coniochaeta ligniaria NRRL 30616]